MTTMRRAWAAWLELSRHIGDFQSRALLTVFYFVVVPVFGVVAHVLDPLGRRTRKVESGYHPRARDREDLASSRLQY
jgi:hypothetical protein